MKYFFKATVLFSILFLSFSCSYKDQKLDLNLTLEKNYQKESKSDVKIRVIDQRADKNLGTKEFGDVKINISSRKNLAILLGREVNDSLEFDICDRNYKKVLEIRILELDYKAKRAFFVGSSKGIAKIQVSLLSSSEKPIFSKNYELSLSQKHFISSFASTDKATIEKLINEIFTEILTDKTVTRAL